MEDALQADQTPNWIGALLLGVGAAVVCSLIWYAIVVASKYEVGLVAVLLGAGVGTAVKVGSGNKAHRGLQIASLVITLLAMLLSEYFIVRELILQAAVEAGYTVSDVPLLMPLGDMVEFIRVGIEANPVSILFWLIAAWAAFRIPGPQRAPGVRQAQPGAGGPRP
jgi:hypothetical protein